MPFSSTTVQVHASPLSEADSSTSSVDDDCALQDTGIDSPPPDPSSEDATTQSSRDDRLDLSRLSAQDSVALTPRVRLVYQDEGVRDRFCANAERLLKLVLEDPLSSSTDAVLARKALRYRKVLPRLHQVDHQDPTFDVSSFLGIEWRRQVDTNCT